MSTIAIIIVIAGLSLLILSVLTFGLIFCLVGIGILSGWTAREEIFNLNYSSLHPEFFDQNGNRIPDEIIAFKFPEEEDNDTDTIEDDEEDG